jgi:serine/threonine-protein kinase
MVLRSGEDPGLSASSSSSPPNRPPSWADDERARTASEGEAPGAAPIAITLEQGTLLARKYRLLRPAGFGGMAQLWVAKNEATGAEVCVKVLVPQSSDDDSVERFRREAYAAARLSHRAIVRVFDLVELDANGAEADGKKPAALAIVMELLHGETLADLLMKRGKLPLDEALDIALPFLSALAHAHRAGVVHRDLKPDNVFLATDPDGTMMPKVLDFGVSKVVNADVQPLTFDGVMLGTPSFMSPEQARGARSVDARSDVFSAGIVLYMMIAGKNPFESDTFHSVIAAIIDSDPPQLPVPIEIWKVIAKMLAKDPHARFADATEAGIALRRAAGRSTTTDSGVHSRHSLDVVTTVQPVVETLPTPAPVEEDVIAIPGAGRKRTWPIVAGVLGVGVLIVVAALVRASVASSVSATAAPAGDAHEVRATATPQATVEPTPTVRAIATVAAAPEAGAPIAPPPQDPPPQATAAPPPKPKAPPRASATAPAGSESARPGAIVEPAIVRDPGF